MTVRIIRLWAFSATLLLAGATSALAQTQAIQRARQQSQVQQLRDTVRSNALKEQQRQQTSATTAQAFQSPRAKAQLQSADQAQYDRYRATQRTAVDDFASKQAVQSASDRKTAEPAHAASSH
ncbi:hypothetical protein [Oleiagrimonas soli]|uniref:Flp pilus assembly protein TadB n=1 Tax=Oleiagrimonas soli TaxID=1543381 RepID=A0A099CUQ1_9GAMM|nr:hypothetical protein [Oleiagrimonas soli]KGI77663.1 hypothetical protein LF63_0110310 [Oleiagrimonas soli]MBB6182819.1 Flp pilus assembly protein TadB [Oleiagrimonas soli]